MKSNINILVIFMILAILVIIVYIIVYKNRNRNSTTKYTPYPISTPPPIKYEYPWSWTILVPKDPDAISIGFTPTIDKDTGNIDYIQSMNTLAFYRMNRINGGKNIITRGFFVGEYLYSIDLPIDKFSSNNDVIGITNVILPQNPLPGNIPYPGINVIIYVLNKKTGLLNSYIISRSVTLSADNSSYDFGNINITPRLNNTTINYIIKDCDTKDTKNPPQAAFITFF
jgi:hypothetical protein